MEWPSFVNGSYSGLSTQFTIDETINLFAEVAESHTGTSRAALFGTPGTRLFCALPESPILGEIEITGRGFVVAGGGLYELFNNGSFIKRGSVNAIGPFSMATNAFQLLLSNGPSAYVLDLNTNGFATVPDFPGGKTVTYLDGYFITAGSNGRQFNLSALNNGMVWDPLDFALKEGAADDLLTCIALRKQLWLFGATTTEVWWDTGNNNFPFQPLQGVLLQEGTAAAYGPTIVGNGIYWIGRDSRGTGTVFAEQNYTPQRVSNFPLERALEKYPNISDAIGSSYQEEGHDFFLMHLPSAQTTWALDTSNGLWHKRGFWDTALGAYKTAVGRYHMNVFGKHLVGGGDNTGHIYEQSLDFYTDNGAPIRRLRRAPHLASMNRKIRYSRVELEYERGVTVPVTGEESDTDPQFMMRFSRNGGASYSNERLLSAGEAGDYSVRAIARMLGSARNFVMEVSSTAAYRHVWMNVYVNNTPGTEAV